MSAHHKAASIGQLGDSSADTAGTKLVIHLMKTEQFAGTGAYSISAYWVN
jgi:hypothetical protein